MAIVIWVSIGSGNSLLLDNTKPLPSNQCWLIIINEAHCHSAAGNFTKNILDITLYISVWNDIFEDTATSPEHQWLKEKFGGVLTSVWSILWLVDDWSHWVVFYIPVSVCLLSILTMVCMSCLITITCWMIIVVCVQPIALVPTVKPLI